MHIMKDGRPYTSRYCYRHPLLLENFNGKRMNTELFEETKEFAEHMKSVKLEPIVINNHLYLRCPKCKVQTSVKE